MLTWCCFFRLFWRCRDTTAAGVAAAPAGDASGTAQGAEVELFAPAAAGHGQSKVAADAGRQSDQGLVTGDYEVAVGGSPALLW
jgi:hypothetical protein